MIESSATKEKEKTILLYVVYFVILLTMKKGFVFLITN
jgi:hypothetical protein